MLLEGGFLVSSQAQLQNVSESHRDTFVIIVQEMQLHLISTNQDFLEFLFFADALGPSSNTGNSQGHAEAGAAEGPTQRARSSSLGGGFSHAASLRVGPFDCSQCCFFPSFPHRFLCLTIELLSHCPPFFIANNYL